MPKIKLRIVHRPWFEHTGYQVERFVATPNMPGEWIYEAGFRTEERARQFCVDRVKPETLIAEFVGDAA